MFDAVLIIDSSLNEAQEVVSPFSGIHPDSQFSLGNFVRGSLAGLGRGYQTQIVDYGSDIHVYVSYCSQQTGKTAGANFLIKAYSQKGDGIVKVGPYRYRTVSSINQAVSYIRSRCSALQNKCMSSTD